MGNRYILIGILAIVACFGSCQSKSRPAGKAGKGPAADTVVSSELPLPEVPPTLTVPSERAAYILTHFWDALDVRDTLRSYDSGFMEQGIVNWLSLFPHAAEEDLPRCIDACLDRMVKDKTAFRLLGNVVEQYLNGPNSPMRNETYYILYLERVLCLPGLTEEERLRPAYQLETARKNRPGSLATDFSYLTREGKPGRLRDTAPGKRLLLLFYDPACVHCTETLKELYHSPVLERLMADQSLSVLAVYTEGDRELWDRTKASLPGEWMVAMDMEGIVERELYALPAMPVIYLLEKDKTVLLKDPTPTDLEAWLLLE